LSFSLPVKIRNILNIEKGDELIVLRDDDSIIVKKLKKDDFSDLLKHSEKVADKMKIIRFLRI